MANINGKWKTEWKRRVAYFDKAVGKAEKRDRQGRHVARQTEEEMDVLGDGFKKKKVHETKLEKLFEASMPHTRQQAGPT